MTTQKMQRVHSDFAELLISIFDFMRRSGIPDEEIRAISSLALNGAIENDAALKPTADLATAALALDAWHRDRRYLNKRAEPRGIPLLGRAPSVEALVRTGCSSREATALARKFISLGLLIRCGRSLYKPAGRVALVAKLDPLIQQYVARSSSTLLRTIKHNISATRRAPRLIERFTEVPDLPVRCAAEFREFAQVQGWALLKTLNDWLESRRVTRTQRPADRTVRAGVHLYAYIDKPPKLEGRRK